MGRDILYNIVCEMVELSMQTRRKEDYSKLVTSRGTRERERHTHMEPKLRMRLRMKSKSQTSVAFVYQIFIRRHDSV